MSSPPIYPHAGSLLTRAEYLRLQVDGTLSARRRTEMGQFMTPAPIAEYMASLFHSLTGDVRLLDPGAGVGSLTCAVLERALASSDPPCSVHIDAYELEEKMLSCLVDSLASCERACNIQKIPCETHARIEDFIIASAEALVNEGGLFSRPVQRYTHCVMNPPYRKIRSNSVWRTHLKSIGIETSNLYTGFLATAVRLLEPQGELVAIVPRSFCNGVYFRPFRQFFLQEMAIKHLHVFEARDEAFRENDVLQENIIIHAIKSSSRGQIAITSSSNTTFEDMTYREVSYHEVVQPTDLDHFINIPTSIRGQLVADRLSVFHHTLADLHLSVSTGPVVDFRLKAELRSLPEQGTVPLIYPAHFSGNTVTWPKLHGRKPNALLYNERSRPWLMPNGWYVLTRRFSAKEERRRIVASIFDPDQVSSSKIAFENHLNVFHRNGAGLEASLAKGLAVYLNSTLVDLHFRQFSGHTQVNATDLRALRYPSEEVLKKLGQQIGTTFPGQNEIDILLDKEISAMSSYQTADPVQMQRKIDEALALLTELGLPKGQRNERSALTFLALLNLKPSDPWANAAAPLMGITPIMDFARDFYGRSYAPNTRETFRRFTMHQFVQAGIALSNPDQPDRPTNSPKWVYQVAPDVLKIVKQFGTVEWQKAKTEFLREYKTLADRYASEREMNLVPLTIRGESLNLSSGAHSQLIKAIIEQFGPRFVPGADVLYIGDTGSKLVHFDEAGFQSLGLTFDMHGKFPDVVLYYRDMNWLLLIEAVTSHGPVDAKRHQELRALFSRSTAGLVYVTAFPDRQTMSRYLPEISWETEVWIADAPTHMVHFDGETFLGPH